MPSAACRPLPTLDAEPQVLRMTVRALIVAITVNAFIAPVSASAQRGATDGQWRSFAADVGSTKYSSLDQIDRDNVGDLRVAWSRLAVDASIAREVPEVLGRRLIGTPLMVDGILYLPNAVGLVEALDPGTGETLWIQEPWGGGQDALLSGTSTRGVA